MSKKQFTRYESILKTIDHSLIIGEAALCLDPSARQVISIYKKRNKPALKQVCLFVAEKVGFEPTCPEGQLHFECSSL